MTLTAERSEAGSADRRTTSRQVGVREVLRRYRVPLLVLVLLLVALAVLGLLRRTTGGTLDPRSYSQGGAHAVVTVLAGLGVPTEVVGDVPDLAARARAGSNIVLSDPAALTPAERERVGEIVRDSGASLLVLSAIPADLEALKVDVVPAGVQDTELRQPACAAPAAERAGSARTGGVVYDVPRGATGCYAVGGTASLLLLPTERVALLGAPDVFTNQHAGQDGNASLALGLLATAPDGKAVQQVLWVVPRPDRAVLGSPTRTIGALVPDAIVWGAVQVAVAIGVLALWRARRLGRVVTEPLPIVVRAAEATEGRGRLHEAAGARAEAAEALRSGARARLGRRLRVPPETGPEGLVDVASARLGQDPRRVGDLLYGAAPQDDTGLVRLARELDTLDPPASPTTPSDRPGSPRS